MNPDKLINCIAVDDEPPALQLIEKYIHSVPVFNLVGTCANAVDALTLLQNNTVDLLFLDIQMPHILGTEFMRTLSNPPKVIFTTAFRKFAVEGFDLDAVDYLLKPISFERFLKAVNKVMKLHLTPVKKNVTAESTEPENEDKFLFLRSDRKSIKIHLDDLLFVESLKNYIKVVTKEKTLVTKYSISALEESLPPAFIRIHRSFIIAKDKIEAFSHDFVHIGKYELPVSRSYRHEVEKILKSKH